MSSTQSAAPDPDASLPAREDLHHALWLASTDAYLVADLEGTILMANPAVLEVLGYVPERLVGRHLSEIRCALPGQSAGAAPALDLAAAQPRLGLLQTDAAPAPAIATRADGVEIAVDVAFSNVELPGTNLRVARYRDASARASSDRSLVRENAFAHGLLDRLADGLLATDRSGLVTYLNPAGAALVGWCTGVADGLPWQEVLRLVGETPGADPRDPVAAVLANGQPSVLGGMAMLMRHSGEVFPVEGAITPLEESGGGVRGALILFRDVSFPRRLMVELRHRAMHDALTGLLNRDEFERRLRLALARIQHAPTPYRLLHLDLCGFRQVNQDCGHAAGDALLRQVAVALAAPLRKGDALARLGSDSFALLLHDGDAGAVDQVVELVRRAAGDITFVCRDQRLPIAITIGTVDFDDASLGVAELLGAANQACHRVRESGAMPGARLLQT